MTSITNLSRLLLALGNKQYLTEEQYSILLEENGLIPLSNYTLLASGDNRHSGSGEKRQFWSTENSHLQFE